MMGEQRNIAIIAEDDAVGGLLLSESVRTVGLTPLLFGNGVEALEAALTQQPLIVLLDVDMPGLDGYSVCCRLRSSDNFGAAVPIVMVTGHDDTDAIDRAFEAGATDYISKPVNWALLPHRLAYILRNASSAAHIERLAYFDTLTGLPNRERCIAVAERLLSSSRSTGQQVAILYADLNSFKRINDTFGHSVGDEVLKRVATALTAAVQPHRAAAEHLSVCRLGGDEFVILVQDIAARQLALRIAETLCVALHDPITLEQLEFFAKPSIGVAVFPDDGHDVETLLKHADTAMYHAKTSGVATVSLYQPAMSARLRDWLELESRLRKAVREDALALRFQPKIRISTGTLAGVEALIRWYDPELGEIAPSRFVPVAEETGLIVEMANWTIRAACRQLRAWLAKKLEIPIAVNLSGKELAFGDPAGVIEAALREFAVPAAMIEVEITESVFVSDSTKARGNIQRIRDLGCRIALDDFGTGYSSLAYLSRFPPDRLKIDRSFVLNLGRSESDDAIVDAIMSLARSLRLVVTAEGVESQLQLEWLKSRGCQEAQGYLLARPLSPEDLEASFSALDPRPAVAARGGAL